MSFSYKFINSLKKMFLSEKRHKKDLPLKGYQKSRTHSGAVEKLTDKELITLNNSLPWNCFTVDSKGRRFGNRAWSSKRETPQVIPDPRIIEMNRCFSLEGKSVLELGCFEGVHTVGLVKHGALVRAVDSRIENIIKTIVRIGMFECKADVLLCDLDSQEAKNILPQAELAHHVGVLYHLKDPVSHLLFLGELVSDGILLDTHYAKENQITGNYTINEKEYKYFKYRERGRDVVFAGMYDHAKWLLLDDILAILGEMGFSEINITNNVEQRNGSRVTLYAAKPGKMKN